MALLHLGRRLAGLHRLPPLTPSCQPFRFAQYSWWGSTAAGSENKPSSTNGEPTTTAADTDRAAAAASAADEPNAEAAPPLEEVLAELNETKANHAKLQEQVEQLTDRLKRSLAEMENVRARSAREVEAAKKFGPQSLLKELLDVPDNLERAASSVPESSLTEEGGADADKLRSVLRGLLEGVRATERILLQVMRKQGVEQYNPVGDKFDPNLHNALFEVPDASKEAGIVAAVTKRGYKLHDRVIRPAEVGVTRAP